MKRVTILSLICLFVFSCTTIQQNEEGVAIHRTERDSSKVYEAVKGRNFTAFDFNTSYIQIPMYQQKGVLRHIEIKTKDRVTFSLDSIVYTYQPLRGRGVDITRRYRNFTSNNDFFEAVEDNIFEMSLKVNALNTGLAFTSDSMLTHTNDFYRAVKEGLNKEFQTKGFDFIDITMEVHEPASIRAIMESKSKSLQEAEAAKAEATKAQSRQLVIEAEQKSRVAEAKADLEVATLQAQERRITTATYSKEYLDFLRITYWGEAKCPAQTVFLYGTQAVDLQK